MAISKCLKLQRFIRTAGEIVSIPARNGEKVTDLESNGGNAACAQRALAD
jgi:hypothetical protein